MDFNQPLLYSKPYSAKKTETKAAYYDMIVFSPVRWNFIYQRPQHIVSRMAKKRNILFVELPIDFDANEKGEVNLIMINDQITLMQPKVAHVDELKEIIHTYVTNDIVPIGMFFSPMFSSFLEVFTFDKVVYDCVNDTVKSSTRSFEMQEREGHLIAEADLILTNETMIYDSKYQDHPNVHCLPNLNELYNGKLLPTAILDRTAERMEVLIRSCRNYGVLI
ncbi:MAG: putative glycosyl transferase [Chitinophagaceae bacterium]|nr:putative glycosyl transferase [Chitinophagaceae bacterium]